MESDGTAINQKHYQIASVEPIEIIQMYLSQEQPQGYLQGNALKYLLQLHHKDESKKEIDKAYQNIKCSGNRLVAEKSIQGRRTRS